MLGPGPRLVVEADEFDRSFLQLWPDAAVVTSADADHLDIYGTHEAVREAFAQFISQIKPGGALILKKGVELAIRNREITVYRYSYDSPCDFYARNIRVGSDGRYTFDLVCPDRVLADCTLGVPGWVNVENAVAAAALLWVAGFDEAKLKGALASFGGVKRRFDFYINTPQRIYMDDYAHHPNELKAAITSFREMFPGRRLTVVFQPHLYTRTRDFCREFAAVLSLADEVLLLPIYPAREEPIEGVCSEMLLPLITAPARVVPKMNCWHCWARKSRYDYYLWGGRYRPFLRADRGIVGKEISALSSVGTAGLRTLSGIHGLLLPLRSTDVHVAPA